MQLVSLVEGGRKKFPLHFFKRRFHLLLVNPLRIPKASVVPGEITPKLESLSDGNTHLAISLPD
jgi:hypothetical protein